MEKNELAKSEIKDGTISERFTTQVIKEFQASSNNKLDVTDKQRGLIQGYFIGIDRALKMAEDKRLSKSDSDKTLPINWNNINMRDLAIDVMNYSKMGLNMALKNHLNAIPYLNKRTQKYDIGFIKGYEGIKYLAMKYAITQPKAVTIELVYSSDKFELIKKGKDSQIESYNFIITNPFDRGTIVGGFGYLEYENPAMNKVIIMTEKDILKRKPKYASAEFWGGEKEVYENGRRTGKRENIEGWKEEMYRKTLERHVYGQIPLDPDKIDENFRVMQLREAHMAEMEAKAEIEEMGGTIDIDIEGNVIEVEPQQKSTPKPITMNDFEEPNF